LKRLPDRGSRLCDFAVARDDLAGLMFSIVFVERRRSGYVLVFGVAEEGILAAFSGCIFVNSSRSAS
jgi:hypothetical protein